VGGGAALLRDAALEAARKGQYELSGEMNPCRQADSRSNRKAAPEMPIGRLRRHYRMLIIFACLTAGVALINSDDHRMNARYLLWRYTAIGDWQREMRFLNVDVSFRRSFLGQPRTRLLRWFPDLEPGTNRLDTCPNTEEYAQFREKLRHSEWIGRTPWLVTDDSSGAVQEVTLPKGC
jgi:hypothetical protein